MENKRFLCLPRNVFVAGIVSLFMDISSEMVYPLVPVFLTTILGATKTTVGIIEGIAESTASLLKVFSGYLSDRLGKRKPLMALGYLISTLSRPVLALSSSSAWVLTARFIDRFGKGVRTSPRDAIIADSVDNSEFAKAYGFHRAMDTVGAMIGPVIATLILLAYLGNLRLVFILSAIPAVISVLLIVFFIKEKPTDKKENPMPRLSFNSFNGEFKRYIAAVAIFSLGNFSDAFLILRAQSLGIEKEMLPLLYLLYSAVYAVTSAPTGMFADRIGIKKVIILGFIIYALVYAGFAFARTPMEIWLLFSAYGFYKGISDGTQRAYVARMTPPQAFGTAFGIYHTSIGIMLLPASIIAGALWDGIGPEATFLYGIALAIVAAIVFMVPIKKSRATPTHL